MMRMHVRATLAALLFAAGCAADRPSPTKEDFGAYPSDYQHIVKTWLGDKLKNPKATTYDNWRGPGYSWYDSGRERVYGFEVCVDVNGKKSFGGTIGIEFYSFFIRNGEVLRWRHVPGPGAGNCRVVEEAPRPVDESLDT
jgi:hypothetical protein